MIRAAVLMKQVPASATLGLDPETGNLIRNNDTLINPADERALNLALHLPECEVSVFTMGPSQAVQLLQTAACYNVKGLFHLCDRAFAGSDTYQTARTLHAALERFGPFDLVLCGRRAVDGETGQVGPELSALLDVPLIADAVQISVEADDVLVKTQNTQEESVYRCPFPCVITVSEGAPALRPASILGMRRAKNAVIRTVSCDDLDLTASGLAGSPTRVKRTHPVQTASRKKERIISQQDAMDRILSLLKGGAVRE